MAQHLVGRYRLINNEESGENTAFVGRYTLVHQIAISAISSKGYTLRPISRNGRIFMPMIIGNQVGVPVTPEVPTISYQLVMII
jgi:hypothetical protein